MERRNDLERQIRESYGLARQYEDLLRTDSDPKRRLNHLRERDEQWQSVKSCLEEYLCLCNSIGEDVPREIEEIAVKFKELVPLLRSIQKDCQNLRQSPTVDHKALDRLMWVFDEFSYHHAYLNEWKELHDLLQECVNSFAPLKVQVELWLASRSDSTRDIVRAQWKAYRTLFYQLECFARGVKYIDDPLSRNTQSIPCRPGIPEVLDLRKSIDHSLQEDVMDAVCDDVLTLWDCCLSYLYKVDKNLCDEARTLCMLSQALTRGANNAKPN